jgi:hypothetical protein
MIKTYEWSNCQVKLANRQSLFLNQFEHYRFRITKKRSGKTPNLHIIYFNARHTGQYQLIFLNSYFPLKLSNTRGNA